MKCSSPVYTAASVVGFTCSGVMVTKLSQPPPRSGYPLAGVASRTAGNCRSAIRSARTCASTCDVDRPMSAHMLAMTKTLASSTPLFADRLPSRWWMMNSALHTMASVSAICSAISMVPALCRRSAVRMGLT